MAWSHSSAASAVRPAMNRAAASVTESRMPSSVATSAAVSVVSWVWAQAIARSSWPSSRQMRQRAVALLSRVLASGASLRSRWNADRGGVVAQRVQRRCLDVPRADDAAVEAHQAGGAERLAGLLEGGAGLTADQGQLRMVELQLEPAGVLPALPVGEVLDSHAQSRGQDLEQVGAGAALAALDPRQVSHRGVRAGQLGLGEPRGDAGRLDPSAEQPGVECRQLLRELGGHEAHLALNCLGKGQVPEFGDASDGCEPIAYSLTHGGIVPPP